MSQRPYDKGVHSVAMIRHVQRQEIWNIKSGEGLTEPMRRVMVDKRTCHGQLTDAADCGLFVDWFLLGCFIFVELSEQTDPGSLDYDLPDIDTFLQVLLQDHNLSPCSYITSIY